jgi:hypothetical protein
MSSANVPSSWNPLTHNERHQQKYRNARQMKASPVFAEPFLRLIGTSESKRRQQKNQPTTDNANLILRQYKEKCLKILIPTVGNHVNNTSQHKHKHFSSR